MGGGPGVSVFSQRPMRHTRGEVWREDGPRRDPMTPNAGLGLVSNTSPRGGRWEPRARPQPGACGLTGSVRQTRSVPAPRAPPSVVGAAGPRSTPGSDWQGSDPPLRPSQVVARAGSYQLSGKADQHRDRPGESGAREGPVSALRRAGPRRKGSLAGPHLKHPLLPAPPLGGGAQGLGGAVRLGGGCRRRHGGTCHVECSWGPSTPRKVRRASLSPASPSAPAVAAGSDAAGTGTVVSMPGFSFFIE